MRGLISSRPSTGHVHIQSLLGHYPSQTYQFFIFSFSTNFLWFSKPIALLRQIFLTPFHMLSEVIQGLIPNNLSQDLYGFSTLIVYFFFSWPSTKPKSFEWTCSRLSHILILICMTHSSLPLQLLLLWHLPLSHHYPTLHLDIRSFSSYSFNIYILWPITINFTHLKSISMPPSPCS